MCRRRPGRRRLRLLHQSPRRRRRPRLRGGAREGVGRASRPAGGRRSRGSRLLGVAQRHGRACHRQAGRGARRRGGGQGRGWMIVVGSPSREPLTAGRFMARSCSTSSNARPVLVIIVPVVRISRHRRRGSRRRGVLGGEAALTCSSHEGHDRRSRTGPRRPGGRRPRRRPVRRGAGRRLGSRRDRRAPPGEPRRRGAERGRSALQPADLRRCARGEVRLPRPGADPVGAARGAPVRGARRAPRRAPVRRGRPAWRAGGSCWAVLGMGRRAGPFERLRALRRRRALLRRSTRSPCATAREPRRRRATLFAPTFSIWTTIEECLNPAARLGAPAAASTPPHRALLGARALHLPGGHRRRRVRERRARGGRARAAGDRLPTGHVQVRARRGVHRVLRTLQRARARSQVGPVQVRGVQVAPRDLIAAVLP